MADTTVSGLPGVWVLLLIVILLILFNGGLLNIGV